MEAITAEAVQALYKDLHSPEAIKAGGVTKDRFVATLTAHCTVGTRDAEAFFDSALSVMEEEGEDPCGRVSWHFVGDLLEDIIRLRTEDHSDRHVYTLGGRSEPDCSHVRTVSRLEMSRAFGVDTFFTADRTGVIHSWRGTHLLRSRAGPDAGEIAPLNDLCLIPEASSFHAPSAADKTAKAIRGGRKGKAAAVAPTGLAPELLVSGANRVLLGLDGDATLRLRRRVYCRQKYNDVTGPRLGRVFDEHLLPLDTTVLLGVPDNAVTLDVGTTAKRSQDLPSFSGVEGSSTAPILRPVYLGTTGGHVLVAHDLLAPNKGITTATCAEAAAHTGSVVKLRFVPELSAVVSAGWDGSLCLSDPTTLQGIARLGGPAALPAEPTLQSQFRPDAPRFTTSSRSPRHGSPNGSRSPTRRRPSPQTVTPAPSPPVTSTKQPKSPVAPPRGSVAGQLKEVGDVRLVELERRLDAMVDLGRPTPSTDSSPRPAPPLTLPQLRPAPSFVERSTVVAETQPPLRRADSTARLSRASTATALLPPQSAAMQNGDGGHSRMAVDFSFNPFHNFVASVGLEREVVLWNPSIRRASLRLPHTDLLKAVTFGAGEHELFSLAGDNVIRLWDIRFPRVVQQIGIHPQRFGPVGRIAYAAKQDQLVVTTTRPFFWHKSHYHSAGPQTFSHDHAPLSDSEAGGGGGLVTSADYETLTLSRHGSFAFGGVVTQGVGAQLVEGVSDAVDAVAAELERSLNDTATLRKLSRGPSDRDPEVALDARPVPTSERPPQHSRGSILRRPTVSLGDVLRGGGASTREGGDDAPPQRRSPQSAPRSRSTTPELRRVSLGGSRRGSHRDSRRSSPHAQHNSTAEASLSATMVLEPRGAEIAQRRKTEPMRVRLGTPGGAAVHRHPRHALTPTPSRTTRPLLPAVPRSVTPFHHNRGVTRRAVMTPSSMGTTMGTGTSAEGTVGTGAFGGTWRSEGTGPLLPVDERSGAVTTAAVTTAIRGGAPVTESYVASLAKLRGLGSARPDFSRPDFVDGSVGGTPAPAPGAGTPHRDGPHGPAHRPTAEADPPRLSALAELRATTLATPVGRAVGQRSVRSEHLTAALRVSSKIALGDLSPKDLKRRS